MNFSINCDFLLEIREYIFESVYAPKNIVNEVSETQEINVADDAPSLEEIPDTTETNSDSVYGCELLFLFKYILSIISYKNLMYYK